LRVKSRQFSIELLHVKSRQFSIEMCKGLSYNKFSPSLYTSPAYQASFHEHASSWFWSDKSTVLCVYKHKTPNHAKTNINRFLTPGRISPIM